jgi:hypothetical protein
MLLMGGAAHAAPVYLLGPAVSLPVVAFKATPFKGRATVAITGVTPDPGGLLISGAGTGEATHLARFTREETLLLAGDGSFTGHLTFKAANGDLLFVAFEGQFTSPATSEGSYTIVGGTGRLAGATGNANFSASTADGLVFALAFDGSISF